MICTFGGLEDIGAGVEGDQQAGDSSFGDFAQEGFQLGIGLLIGSFRGSGAGEVGAGRLYELLDLPLPYSSTDCP